MFFSCLLKKYPCRRRLIGQISTPTLATPTMPNSTNPALVHRKIAVLGFRAVGKTSLTNAFVSGTFSENYDPTIENTHHKTIRFRKVHFATDIIDTAGMVSRYMLLFLLCRFVHPSLSTHEIIRMNIPPYLATPVSAYTVMPSSSPSPPAHPSKTLLKSMRHCLMPLATHRMYPASWLGARKTLPMNER